MLKNKNFVFTVILPIFLSIIIGIVIVILNNSSILHTRAVATVKNEERTFSKEIKQFEDEKEALLRTAAEHDAVLEENRLEVEQITTLSTELGELNTDIEDAKEKIEELDGEIESKTTYNEGLSSIVPAQPGTPQSFTDKKLNIPSDLKAGRYTADGTGKIMIYTIAGTLKDKQDLSLLDTHTYTFNIASGESLKIEGTLSLTEIIEQ